MHAPGDYVTYHGERSFPEFLKLVWTPQQNGPITVGARENLAIAQPAHVCQSLEGNE